MVWDVDTVNAVTGTFARFGIPHCHQVVQFSVKLHCLNTIIEFIAHAKYEVDLSEYDDMCAVYPMHNVSKLGRSEDKYMMVSWF